MDYSMEELIPIVAGLAEKLTGKESTSITYEKAEQLMGAVLYCIHEAEENQQTAIASKGRVSAEEVYRIGYKKTAAKVKAAMELYNSFLPQFEAYGNLCLYDTVVKGIPEFFKWYDIRFEPQNEILTLDYPVLEDITQYEGIDKVYRFLHSIYMEQLFFAKIDREHILQALCPFDEDMIDNLCRIVLADIIRRTAFHAVRQEEMKEHVTGIVTDMVNRHYGGNRELLDYLLLAVGDIAVRLQTL